MNKEAVKRLVNEAVKCKSYAAMWAKREEAIKTKLAEIGVRFKDEWEPTEGGGSSWTAQGSTHFARVTYPIDKLKDAIDASTKGFIPIRQAAGGAFKQLFEAANFFKPVADFRKIARELLPKATAEKLIKLCQSDNKPKVSFEVGEKDRE